MSDPSWHWSVEHLLQQCPKRTALGQLAFWEESILLARPANKFPPALEELDIIGLVFTVQKLLDVDVDALERLE
jgi:hypothetical protein